MKLKKEKAEATEMMKDQKPKSDLSGKTLGMGVFILGIVLLLVVFNIAYVEMTSFDITPSEASSSEGSSDPLAAIADLGGIMDTMSRMMLVSVRLAFMFVMAYCASAIARRGSQMYRASKFVPEIIQK